MLYRYLIVIVVPINRLFNYDASVLDTFMFERHVQIEYNTTVYNNDLHSYKKM